MAFWTNHRWGITFFIGIEHRVLLNHYFLQDYRKFYLISKVSTFLDIKTTFQVKVRSRTIIHKVCLTALRVKVSQLETSREASLGSKSVWISGKSLVK